MFETTAVHQLLSDHQDFQAWKIVMLNRPCPWFYVTVSDYSSDGGHLRTWMMLITDPLIFRRVIHLKSESTKYGHVYLMMPVGEPGSERMTWDHCRLVAMKEFDPDNGDDSAYAYLTADGAWEDARVAEMNVEGRMVYKSPDYDEQVAAADVTDEYIASLARQVFTIACELHGGDMRAAAAWLQTPMSALGNLAPIDITEDDLPRLMSAIGKEIRDIIM
jgi:hypothetical protein